MYRNDENEVRGCIIAFILPIELAKKMMRVHSDNR